MGKSSAPTIGYWYRVAYHHGLTIGPIDAFLEFRGGDKTAWQGELTSSATISVNAPFLWGGEKDQGGIQGNLAVMFGEDTQVPHAYLVSVFGNQTVAWRGFATVAFLGGRYGAMNPYPQAPSYKIRRILEGWDGGVAWYPSRAPILLASFNSPAQLADWRYLQIGRTDATDYSAPGFDDSGWATGSAPFGGWEAGYGPVEIARGAPTGLNDAPAYDVRFSATFATPWAANTRLWLRRKVVLAAAPVGVLKITAYIEDSCQIYVNGTLILSTSPDHDGGIGQYFEVADHHLVAGDNVIAIRCDDEAPVGSVSVVYADFILEAEGGSNLLGINPAHVLYESRTNGDMGREPTANINDASLRAAADRLFAEGFGICPKWDPAGESVDDFEQRIAKLIGGSFSRSLEDGQWYLDLARGDYVLEELPILTDDDILDFKEQPTVFDSVINSVSVRYFDPERKESIVTAPVRAMGLVAAFGTIHQTYDFPEIATAALATRVALRELLATTTPTRAFDLVTTRKTYAWRPVQYFRLQAPKRGIVDMVCMVGEKGSGTLASGAIKFKATQDIYSLPATSFVEVEPGVDPRPSQQPNAITLQRVLEAPYVEIAGAVSASVLAALADDVGFAMAVAVAPGEELDYTMMVDAGGGYADADRGEWCATATIVESSIGKADTDFTLANGARLDQVSVGMAVLWDDELCRVDAIDAAAGTVTLGRGCGDTVPSGNHAAGSRLWFYEVGFASDTTEYSDGESIDVKLLSNTGSQQLSLGSATPMALTFEQRMARPYPPGKVRVDGVAWPASATGSFDVTWTHRHRVQQADQLVDTEAASIGPEASTRYGLRFENASTDALIVERLDLAGPDATVQLGAGAPASVRMTLWAISDAGESWQTHVHVFTYSGGTGQPSIDGPEYIPDDGEVIVDGNDPPPSTGGSAPPTLPPGTVGGIGVAGSPIARSVNTSVVVNPVTFGADPTGAASSSTAIQAAIDSMLPAGGILRFPAGTYKIDPTNTPKLGSFMRWDALTNNASFFAAGTTSYATGASHKDLLGFKSGAHEVEIWGGVYEGFLDYFVANNLYAGGSHGTQEWGHCFYVGNGAYNVTVWSVTCSKFTGDAMSIGYLSHHVNLVNFKFLNCRRQGLSNGGDDVLVEDGDIGYIGTVQGTAPKAGIDNEVDNPSVNSSLRMTVNRVRAHHCAGPGFMFYKSCNDAVLHDCISEYNTKGVYAVDSDNVTISGNTKLRYNKYEGMHLTGTSAGWDVRADFFGNKTKQYGTPSGTGTTTSPTSTLRARHVTLASSVGAPSYDPTTTWGPT